jgi:hypothetical protein
MGNNSFPKLKIKLKEWHFETVPGRESLYMDRLCGLVARVPGYRTDMYCVSWEV